MVKLQAVKCDVQTKLWCGPAAVSAITGVPVSRVLKIMKKLSWSSRVLGVANSMMIKTMRKLGYELKEVRRFDYERPTLQKYAEDHFKDFAQVPCIVVLTGHYITLHGGMFCDNHTKVPVHLNHAPHRRKTVKKVWQVTKIKTVPVVSSDKATASETTFNGSGNPPEPKPSSELV